MTSSDFTVSTINGVTTATYSGEISTVVTLNSDQQYDFNFEVYAGAISSIPVPEPSCLTLTGFGMLSLLGYGWRQRNRTA